MQIPDLLLLAEPPRSILLRTRTMNAVPNYVAPEATPQEVEDYWTLRSGKVGWTNRRPPGGGYNCMGHACAARRCTILPEHAAGILADDRYATVPLLQAREGDMIVWRLPPPSEEIAHAGIVVSANPLRILSKWNEAPGEDEHPYGQFLGDMNSVRLRRLRERA